MRLFKTIICVLLLGVALSVQAEKKPEMKKVYIFGFSASFTDSVAFITDIQELDSAVIMPNGFLADRTLYSLQLENHVLGKCRVQNSTNAIFFSLKKKALEKTYDKVNRKYQRSEDLALIYLGEDEFVFKPEEYIESTIEYSDEPVPAPDGTRSPGKPGTPPPGGGAGAPNGRPPFSEGGPR